MPSNTGKVAWTLTDGANSHYFDGRVMAGGECIAFVDLDGPYARLIAAAPDMARALSMQDHAENENANCPECEGEGDWAHCSICAALFGDAIDARQAVLAKATPEPSS
jgi:hypothetical protein